MTELQKIEVPGLVIEQWPVRELTPAEAALREIEYLERLCMMPRVAREIFIVQAEERAIASGYTLVQLRAKNKGYAGLKTLDEQIAALRAQL